LFYTGQGIFSNVGGEVVILNLTTNHYYGLNEVGTFIWDQLSYEPSSKELCSKLMKEYDVAEDRCMNDIREVLLKLEEINLIEKQLIS